MMVDDQWVGMSVSCPSCKKGVLVQAQGAPAAQPSMAQPMGQQMGQQMGQPGYYPGQARPAFNLKVLLSVKFKQIATAISFALAFLLFLVTSILYLADEFSAGSIILHWGNFFLFASIVIAVFPLEKE
ncbi:MAG: hypothetical protein IJW05_03335 [Lentisphaeria bacterium]|nr:hypothetical protein [Lentisphaeria bacterium]